MYRMMAGALLLAASVVPWVDAGNPLYKTNQGPANQNQDIYSGNTGPTVPSAQVDSKVTRLAGQIKWLTSLEEAKEQARKENKPIFWVHVLGDLDGTC
jgi:hypothetical protein